MQSSSLRGSALDVRSNFTMFAYHLWQHFVNCVVQDSSPNLEARHKYPAEQQAFLTAVEVLIEVLCNRDLDEIRELNDKIRRATLRHSSPIKAVLELRKITGFGLRDLRMFYYACSLKHGMNITDETFVNNY